MEGKIMIKKIRLTFIFLGLISILNLLGCSSKSDMYADACKALSAECSNVREFDRVIKKAILDELEQRDELLVKSVNKININLKQHFKDKFLVDLTSHVGAPGRSLEWFKADQLSKQKIYGTDVFLGKAGKQLSIFGGEFQIRTDLTPNKGFTKLIEICSNYPDQLCKIQLTGEIDAVREKSGEGSHRWRGWIDITGYSVQAVDKATVLAIFYSDIRRSVFKEIDAGRSKSLGAFMRSAVDKSVESIL